MLTIEDVSRHWSLGAGAIRSRIRSGDLRAVRVAGKYRMTWPDVWSCEAGKTPGGAGAGRYQTPLLTKAEFAVAMGVSVRTVERWVAQGLPTRNVGENCRLNRHEVNGWVKNRFGLDVSKTLGLGKRATGAEAKA